MKHKKNDIIKDKNGYQKCVCVDNEVAIFAASNRKGTRTTYRKLFAVMPEYWTINGQSQDEGGYFFTCW